MTAQQIAFILKSLKGQKNGTVRGKMKSIAKLRQLHLDTMMQNWDNNIIVVSIVYQRGDTRYLRTLCTQSKNDKEAFGLAFLHFRSEMADATILMYTFTTTNPYHKVS